MYRNEEFKEIGFIGKGEVVVKFPGTDMKMLYSGGKTYVNKSGTVAHLALDLTDFVAEDSGEPANGLLGELGDMIKGQINDPSIRPQLLKSVTANPLSLFYSQVKDGKAIVTIPGFTGEESINAESSEDYIVASYALVGSTPPADQVYPLHAKAVGNQEIVSDPKMLANEALTLGTKANEIYVLGMKLANDFF